MVYFKCLIRQRKCGNGKKGLLNVKLKSQGRTANQYKKYIEKQKERGDRGLF